MLKELVFVLFLIVGCSHHEPVLGNLVHHPRSLMVTLDRFTLYLLVECLCCKNASAWGGIEVV